MYAVQVYNATSKRYLTVEGPKSLNGAYDTYRATVRNSESGTRVRLVSTVGKKPRPVRTTTA